MDYSAAALYVVAVVAYTASPGPMMAVLLSRSIGPAWKSALPLAFGFCISRIIVVVVLAFGLGVWLAERPDIIFFGKALGASYLAWLAVGMWIGSAKKVVVDEKQGHWLASVAAGIALGLGNAATFLIYVILLQIIAPSGFTGLSHISFACLITLSSVATVYLGTILFARRLHNLVASQSSSLFSSLFLSRVAATTLALTSLWIVTA
jgi:threonine/homoserine/homoserine lactone efflux protein